MRTTLDLEKSVLQALKRLQKREKTTLGSIASRLLADALRQAEAAQTTPRGKLAWFTSNMGAKFDLADKDAIFRALDEKP